MDFLRNHKTTMIGVGLIALIFVVYVVFFAGTSNDGSELIVSGPNDGGPAGKEIIILLSQLQGIDLDVTVIESAAFQNLVDFNKEVPDQPYGRSNPFLPIGR